MISLPPFALPGHWFKGSLHTHTTESDGHWTPAQVIQWHADHGYHVLAITDHNRVTDPAAFVTDPPLLVIPSVEISARRDSVEYHVVAIGVNGRPSPHGGSAALPYFADPQAAIDAANAAGGLAFIAHPYWHDHLAEDLLPLHDHIGIEIFNTGSWLEIQKGHSLVHWDALLRRGQRLWGLAVDDAHFRYPDYGRGWVMLRAERLDTPSVLAALRAGHFYSTMGPTIDDLQLTGREVIVRCSPARSIYLIGDYNYCPHAAQSWDGTPLTEARFTLHPQQHYLRVEVVDMAGQSAWSNAYFVNE